MADVAETTLRNILANAKVRPFKKSYYCEKRAPDFDSKMHDVLVVYKQISLQFNEDGTIKPFEGTPYIHCHMMRNRGYRLHSTEQAAGSGAG